MCKLLRSPQVAKATHNCLCLDSDLTRTSHQHPSYVVHFSNAVAARRRGGEPNVQRSLVRVAAGTAAAGALDVTRAVEEEPEAVN